MFKMQLYLPARVLGDWAAGRQARSPWEPRKSQVEVWVLIEAPPTTVSSLTDPS